MGLIKRRSKPETLAKKQRLDKPEKGEIILKQLGGQRFRVMTGAKTFILIDRGLQFALPLAKKGINRVRIQLNAHDTYDLTFWRIRGVKATKISESNNINVSELQRSFTTHTGLETHL